MRVRIAIRMSDQPKLPGRIDRMLGLLDTDSDCTNHPDPGGADKPIDQFFAGLSRRNAR